MPPPPPLPPGWPSLPQSPERPPRPRKAKAPPIRKTATQERIEAAARDYLDRQFEKGRMGHLIDPNTVGVLRAMAMVDRSNVFRAMHESKERRLDAGGPTEIVGGTPQDLTKLSPEDLATVTAILGKLGPE